jgi:hypothetical protein
MAQTFHLREQAERCRRLARDSTDPSLRDSLMKLADEYATRASVEESVGALEDANSETVWRARPNDEGAA